MGIRTIRGEKKFVFETEEERNVLDMARNHFGESSSFLIDGMGYQMKKQSTISRFSSIRRGKYSNGTPCSITVEQWRQIQDYASSYRERIAYADLPLIVKS